MNNLKRNNMKEITETNLEKYLKTLSDSQFPRRSAIVKPRSKQPNLLEKLTLTVGAATAVILVMYIITLLASTVAYLLTELFTLLN